MHEMQFGVKGNAARITALFSAAHTNNLTSLLDMPEIQNEISSKLSFKASPLNFFTTTSSSLTNPHLDQLDYAHAYQLFHLP